MEKRNYVKPNIYNHNIVTSSFIAGSSVNFDDDDPKFEDALETCFQFAGNISNCRVKNYMNTNGLTQMYIKGAAPQSGEGTCGYRDKWVVGKTYQLTYTNGTFSISTTAVSGRNIKAVTNIPNEYATGCNEEN